MGLWADFDWKVKPPSVHVLKVPRRQTVSQLETRPRLRAQVKAARGSWDTGTRGRRSQARMPAAGILR